MPLTSEQFNAIKKEADEAILNYTERKEALKLLRRLEKQMTPSQLLNPELIDESRKMLAHLKWVACPLIKSDEEFFDLVKNNFLEGLEVEKLIGAPDTLLEIILTRFAFQFGLEINKTANDLLRALKENNQTIGQSSIMVKNEKRPARPSIRHWLIDFLRNTPVERPTGVDESNYLFNNQNTGILAEQDKGILGKVINLYNFFRGLAQELAWEERQRLLPGEEESRLLMVEPRQRGGEEAYFDEEIEEPPEPAESTPSPPMPRRVAPPPSLASQPPAPQPSASPYREPVSDEDLAGPETARRPAPRLDGNVIDLSNRQNR